MAEETWNCYKKLKQDLLCALTASREATRMCVVEEGVQSRRERKKKPREEMGESSSQNSQAMGKTKTKNNNKNNLLELSALRRQKNNKNQMTQSNYGKKRKLRPVWFAYIITLKRSTS